MYKKEIHFKTIESQNKFIASLPMNKQELLEYCRSATSTLHICCENRKFKSFEYKREGADLFFTKLIYYIWEKIYGNRNVESCQVGVNLLCYLCDLDNAVAHSMIGCTDVLDNATMYIRGMIKVKTNIRNRNNVFAIDCMMNMSEPTLFEYCINCKCGSSPYIIMKKCMYKSSCTCCYNCIDCCNCKMCIDCTNCKNVVGMYNCANCTDCSDCSDCSDCENISCVTCASQCNNCKKSFNIHSCVDCTNCNICTNCTDCTACSNSSDSTHCKKCKTRNADNCTNCSGTQLTQCVNCINCKDCKNCNKCTDCSSCTNCTGCTGCYTCCDCKNCSKCEYNNKCIRCKTCTNCNMCINQTKGNNATYVFYNRERIDIPNKMLMFKHPCIVDLTVDGERVEMNNEYIQFFDSENNLVFQGICQYKNPRLYWDEYMNFTISQGWFYYPEISKECCYVILSTKSKYSITVKDLIEQCKNYDQLIEFIKQRTIKAKNSYMYIYDRNGHPVREDVSSNVLSQL